MLTVALHGGDPSEPARPTLTGMSTPRGGQPGARQMAADSKDGESYPDDRRDLPLLSVGAASLVI